MYSETLYKACKAHICAVDLLRRSYRVETEFAGTFEVSKDQDQLIRAHQLGLESNVQNTENAIVDCLIGAAVGGAPS